MSSTATMPLTADRTHYSTQSNNTASAASQAPVLLRAEGLKKAFGGQVVLNGVDLELRQGEVVLLRGENGSGKTTLLNILTGNLEPDAGAIHYLANGTSRTYRFPRHWWQELNPVDHFTPEFVTREGVGRTWQEIRLFGAQTLRDNIAVAEPGHPGENPVLALFAPSRCARREAELNRTADAMLARLGLTGREGSSANKISLGQTKRVAIARAVAAGARILFLDEPLAGLDRQGIGDVLVLLETLVREQRITLVIIEHILNQDHLYGLVTTDWLLAGGAIRQKDRNARGPIPSRSRPSGLSGLSVQRPAWFGLLAGEGADVVDELLPRGALLTRVRRPEVFECSNKPVLKIRGLVVKRGAHVVIGLNDQGIAEGLNLTLYENEIVILQAPNGWGKSTLALTIAGLVPVYRGSIHLKDVSLDKLPVWERIAKGIRVLTSDNTLFPSLQTTDIFKVSRSSYLPNFLQRLRARPLSTLSGGEKQRLALQFMRQAHHGRASLLVFDEPLSALDYEAIRSASELILPQLGEVSLLAVPISVSN